MPFCIINLNFGTPKLANTELPIVRIETEFMTHIFKLQQLQCS